MFQKIKADAEDFVGIWDGGEESNFVDGMGRGVFRESFVQDIGGEEGAEVGVARRGEVGDAVTLNDSEGVAAVEGVAGELDGGLLGKVSFYREWGKEKPRPVALATRTGHPMRFGLRFL